MKNRVVIYCRRFKPCKAAQQHWHGRRLLAQALKEEYQIDFTEDMITLMANGKPCFKELPIFFNISHCSGMAVCALADVPVGVDVETGRRVKDSIMHRVLSPWEQAYVKEQVHVKEQANVKEQPESVDRFLELWTLKESFIKMTGEGLRIPLDTVDFRLRESIEAGKAVAEDGSAAAEEGSAVAEDGSATAEEGSAVAEGARLWRSSNRISCSRPGYFMQWKLDGGYVLSLCTKEEREAYVRQC